MSPIGQIIRTQHGSDNGLWPGLCQAITWTSDDQAHRLQVLSVGTGSNKAGKLKKIIISHAPLWFAIRSVDQHKPDRTTYLMRHTVVKPRCTNMKNQSEISWQSPAHPPPQRLWNYNEQAKRISFQIAQSLGNNLWISWRNSVHRVIVPGS